MLEHEYALATFKGLATPNEVNCVATNATAAAADEAGSSKRLAANKVNKLKSLKAKRSTKTNNNNNNEVVTNENDASDNNSSSRTKLPTLLRQKLRDGNAAFSRLVSSMTHHSSSGSTLATGRGGGLNGSARSTSTLPNGSATAHGNNKSSTLPAKSHLRRKVGSENALQSLPRNTEPEHGKDDPLYDVIANYADGGGGRGADGFLEPALYRCHPSLRRPRKKSEETHLTAEQQHQLTRQLSHPNLLVKDEAGGGGGDRQSEADTESIQTSCLSTGSQYYDLEFGAQHRDTKQQQQALKSVSSQNADNFVYDSEEFDEDDDDDDEEEVLEDGSEEGSKHLVLYFLVK